MIRFLEGVGTPFMLGVGLLLLWWITSKAGGLGPVLSSPANSKRQDNSFVSLFRRSPDELVSGPQSL